MKKTGYIYLGIVVNMLLACNQPTTVNTVEGKKSVELRNSLDSVSYALGINVARTLNGQGFDSINYLAFNNAIAASLNSDSLLIDQTHSLRYINNYLLDLSKSILEKNLNIADNYLDSISKLTGVKKIDDGIYMRILTAGTGDSPSLTDEVVFNFLGKLPDGKEFDNSFERGVPATFNVHSGIDGWQQALINLNQGAMAEIWLHPDKGYGTQGGYNGIIPGNSALYFKIELVEIHRK